MPRLRFSIRDLLLFTVIVALALGWWLDRTRLVEYGREQQQRADKEAAWSQVVRDQWDKLFLLLDDEARIITHQQKEISRLMGDRMEKDDWQRLVENNRARFQIISDLREGMRMLEAEGNSSHP